MKQLFKFLAISLLILIVTSSYGQTDGNYEYTKEFIWGFNKNTNGGLIGGLIFKWSKAIGDKDFRTIGFEIMNVKHPKEVKLSYGQSRFIYGKSNYLYAIRAQYGKDHILFKKAPQQGVQVNYCYAFGPTFGILAPYYVVGSDDLSAQFDPDKYPNAGSIKSTGHLFEGLSKSDLKFGVNAKASLVFEMGAFKSNVTGFEIGTLVEGYTQVIELMPQESNRALFVSGFVTLFYGRRK